MTDSAAKDALIGSRLDGRYLIERRLARGGMSTVYLATDTKLQRQVAIKVLYPHLAEDPSFVARFESEAITAARLSHPHVVSVYDQGVDGDTAYLVLEYVPGATLRDVMASQGRLSPRAALQVIDAVLGGLGAAHAAGLVHRDVKPENVLLSPDGRIKVADFGLARAASKHTSTGALIGTVAYVSPELVTGKPADTRADLYAVGVLFYELLVGSQPFTGETAWEVALAHVNQEVPAASASVQGLSPELDELISWCTEHEPDDRPHDAQALLQELRHVRSQLRDEQLDLGEAPAPLSTLLASTLALLHRNEQAAPSRGQQAQQATADGAGGTQAAGVAAGAGAASGDRPAAGKSSSSGGVFDQAATSDEILSEAPTQAFSSPEAEAPTQVIGSAGAQHAPTAALPTHTAPSDAETVPDAAATRPLSAGDAAGYPTRVLDPDATAAMHTVPQQHSPVPAYGDAHANQTGLQSGGLLPRLPREAQVAEPETEAPVRVSKRQAKADAKERAKAAQTPTEELNRPGTRRRAWIWGIIVVLVASLIGVAAWFFGAGPGARVLIPELRGASEASATAQLSAAGLGVTRSEAFDEEVAPGKVVSTDPASGSEVMKLNSVMLVISKGPQLYATPNLQGLTQAKAKAALVDARLALGKVSEAYNESIAKGLVVDQSVPAAKQVRSGTKVNVVLSKGAAPVDVPALSGKAPEDAQQLLEAQGLKGVQGDDVFSDEIESGRVALQDPAPGTQLNKGSTVTYQVSKGPELFEVPSVINKSTANARQVLEDAGFTVEVKSGGVFGTVFDRVVGQSPRAGTMAKPGTQVTITVY